MSASGVLGRLGADLLALLSTRAELISVELQEERARAELKLALAALAALFLALGLLLAALLLVVIFWDTHRVLAAGGVTAFYLCLGAWALSRLRAVARDSPAPFASTLGEFAKDLRLLRGNHE